MIRSFATALPFLNDKYTLKIIGDGPDKQSLQNMTIKLGINDQVEFLGLIRNGSEYLYGSKLLLTGLSNNTIIESIVTHTPVIALDLGEFKQLYGQYPNVWVIDYERGGYGKIPDQYLPDIIDKTAKKIVEVLNNYQNFSFEYEINFQELGWGKRIKSEVEALNKLFL